MLERVDGLALALAREWLSLDDAPDGVPAPWSDARAALDGEQLMLRRPLRTQRYTRSGKFVDLPHPVAKSNRTSGAGTVSNGDHAVQCHLPRSPPQHCVSLRSGTRDNPPVQESGG